MEATQIIGKSPQVKLRQIMQILVDVLVHVRITRKKFFVAPYLYYTYLPLLSAKTNLVESKYVG